MKTAAQLVAEGYGGYAGWGDPEAWYDFQATGGSGKYTGGSSSGTSGGSTTSYNTTPGALPSDRYPTAAELVAAGYGGYAGWSDPAAGYDYVSTGGSGKWTGGGSAPSGTSGASGTTGNLFSDYYNQYAPEIDRYVDELKEFAAEDYDFAAKWLENQYKIALGNNDTERANFIKSVASKLEEEIGTIAYDYRTGKYRTERDRDTAIARLNEDEQMERQRLNLETGIEREQQAATLNERGLLAGTRAGTKGLASKFVGQLEEDIGRRYLSLSRYYGREKEDVIKEALDRLEDLKTTARRGAVGSQQTYDYGLEKATREKERAELEAEQYGKERKDWLASMAKYMA